MDELRGFCGHNASTQLNLFESLDFDVLPGIKRAMQAAIDASGLSRAQVCDRMNALASRHRLSLNSGNSRGLSLDVLEKWLNPNDDRILNLRSLVIFCVVLGTRAPFEVLLAPCGLQVIGFEERRQIAYADAIIKEKRAGKRRRGLEKELLK